MISYTITAQTHRNTHKNIINGFHSLNYLVFGLRAHPVAKLLSRYFTISTPKRKMDHSSGELEGEIDHLSRDAAVEYLLMPERVKKLEGQLLGLSSQIEDLRSDVSQLVQILKESIIA